jgi:two-component system chemotaxis response regulator CheB
MAARPISVVIVDDSASVRAVLRRFLGRNPEIRIVGEAEDGLAAVETVRRTAPDVLLLDLVLPHLDGFGVLARLAESGAVPTVLLTSRADRSEVRAAFEAIGSGAVDLLPKPDDPASWHQLAETLPAVLTAAAATAKRGLPRPAPLSSADAAPAPGSAAAAPHRAPPARRERPAPAPPSALPGEARSRLRYLALGASTGGPGAMRDLLGALAAPPPFAIFAVQHIARGFEPGLADWLAGALALDVRVAVAGEIVPPGAVRLAPGGVHLRIDGDGRLELDAEAPPRRGHRPSVDELFLSLAAHAPAATAAALLTGMGADGAHGLAELRRRGAYCLVQDEASSAVFGMPRAALELGAAEAALAPAALGEAIDRRAREGPPER